MLLSALLIGSAMVVSDVLPVEESAPPALEEPTEGVNEAQWDTRGVRARDFREQLMVGRKARNAAHDSELTQRSRRSDARSACNDRLRKANRDGRLAVILVCMKQDLTTTLDIVRKRLDGLTSRAGVTADTTALVRARGELLIDALQTIMNALDAGVYTSESELLEARRNLREKYMMPYHALLPRVIREHALAAVAHMLLRSQAMDRSAFPPEVMTAVEAADACLESLEKSLESLSPDGFTAEHGVGLRACLAEYREAHALLQNMNATSQQGSSSSEAQWQKRSLRRFPAKRN